jgi:hypothetical protein
MESLVAWVEVAPRSATHWAQELFGRVGAVKRAMINYDRAGRSLGTATVVYESSTSAAKAIRDYDGVQLDGAPCSHACMHEWL